MKNNMRKFVMIAVLLMGVGACAYAIDYPEYKSPLMKSGVYGAQQRNYTPYTPYSVSNLGGGSTTWDNDGGNGNGGFGGGDNGNGGGGYAPSGPRRAVNSDGTGTPDATWDWNGTTYGYDNNGNVYFWDGENGWTQLANTNPGDVGAPFSPVGSPVLPMLFFALLAAGAVYLRRRKALQA